MMLYVVAVWAAKNESTCLGQPSVDQADATQSNSNESDKVLRHAVFFKFKPSSTEQDVDRIVEAFRALPSKINDIREFQWGKNISRFEGEDRFTHCFLLTFGDEAGRSVYLPHPDHKAFGSVVGPHLAGVFVIDYWGRPQTAKLEKQLKHAVFFKFKENTPEAEIRAVAEGLAGLPSKIDAIKAFEWGTNNSPEKHDQGFTHCFMFTFDSEEGLRDYAVHPEHRSEAGKLVPKMEKMRVIDFWVEDAPSGAGQ
jgi:hypothetical protein